MEHGDAAADEGAVGQTRHQHGDDPHPFRLAQRLPKRGWGDLSQTERRARPPARLDERDGADGGRGWHPRPQLQYHHLGPPADALEDGARGATVSTFELDKLDQSLGEFEDGPADEDEMWERIDHWLQEIMPVAEEYKVQMACHPSDPGIGVGNTYRAWRARWGWSRASKSSSHSTTARTTA